MGMDAIIGKRAGCHHVLQQTPALQRWYVTTHSTKMERLSSRWGYNSGIIFLVLFADELEQYLRSMIYCSNNQFVRSRDIQYGIE